MLRIINRYNIVLGLVIFACVALLTGCSTKSQKESYVQNYGDLVKVLKAEGYKTNDMVESSNDIFVSLFSVKPKRLYVYFEDSRELIHVYEFNSNKLANTEAESISSNGQSVGNLYIGGGHHFYKQGNIIVQYSGENKSIMDILKKGMSKLI